MCYFFTGEIFKNGGTMYKKILFILCIISMSFAFLYSKERLVILGFEHLDQDSRAFMPNLNEKNLKSVPTATDNFVIVIGKEVEKIMKEKGVTTKLINLHADEAGIVGEALNATQVVWGTVGGVGNNMFRVSGTMRNQASGTVAPFNFQLSKIDKNQRNETLKTQLFDKLNEFSKGEIPQIYDMGMSQYNNRQYDAAETSFKRILSIEKNNVSALMVLGRIQYDQRKFRDAVTYYNQALDLEPDNEDLLRYISVAYREQGLIDQSIDALEKIADARANKGDPDITIYYNIALQYRDRARIDEAIAALDKMLALDTDNEWGHRLYAEITFDIGNFEKSIEHLEVIIEKTPDDHDAASKLARAYQRTGQLDRAIEKYQTNIRTNPNNISAYLNLASAYITKGQEQYSVTETNRLNRLALQTYLDAQKVDSNNAGIDSNIAGTYLSLNDISNAERYANTAIQKNSKFPDPHRILASIAQSKGITKDTEFIELTKLCDSGNLYGKELDDTIVIRDRAKRDAHNFFRQAEKHFRDAITATDNDRVKTDINNQIKQNSEFIERTKPGLFE